MEEIGISAPKKYYLFDTNHGKILSDEDSIEGISEQVMTEEEASHVNATYSIGQWMTMKQIIEWLKEHKEKI
jgi:hypothetical protein